MIVFTGQGADILFLLFVMLSGLPLADHLPSHAQSGIGVDLKPENPYRT
jgi:hypothetical protein